MMKWPFARPVSLTPNPLPVGEGDEVSLRELHVKAGRAMGGWRIAIALLAAVVPAAAAALEYRSIASDRVVMYDAPSLHGRKLYLASRYYPVEVIVSLEAFAKVRDAAGDLSWVEKKNLSDKRMVLISVALADVYQTPDAKALAFQAERGVVLELLEYAGSGWIKVRHPDGATGYVRTSQVWGS